MGKEETNALVLLYWLVGFRIAKTSRYCFEDTALSAALLVNIK